MRRKEKKIPITENQFKLLKLAELSLRLIWEKKEKADSIVERTCHAHGLIKGIIQAIESEE